MRLIRGRHGWWCVTESGVALLSETLVRGGQLTAAGRAEADRIGLLAPQRPTWYSVTVLTSTACNLGCAYCFQNTSQAEPGRFDPPRIARTVLRSDVTEATARFVGTRMRELGVSRLRVLLFGGEPLLNPVACRSLLARCAELGEVSGSIITNGVLLTPRRAVELSAVGLRSAQVTFDGPGPVHDQVRATRNGKPTFDTILANVAAAQRATDIQFILRVNLTPSALAGLPDLLMEIAAAVDATKCRLRIAPVDDYGHGFGQLLRSSHENAQRILDGYVLAQQLGFGLVRPQASYCPFCSHRDGRYGAVVNADGTLYSSWESVGQAGFEVGTVFGGYTDYPSDRWVRCGHFVWPAGPIPDTSAFRDEIDAGVLDLIRARRLPVK